MARGGSADTEDRVSATIHSVDGVDEGPELRSIIREYLDGVVPHFRVRLGGAIDVEDMLDATLGRIADYQPPRGRVLLARGREGELLGTCFLRRIRPDAVERKRLFLRPAGRGSGLGRQLVDRALSEARAMGAARVLLDTGIWMSEARALYRAVGFREIPSYPESENPEEVRDLLVCMELVLPPSVSRASP